MGFSFQNRLLVSLPLTLFLLVLPLAIAGDTKNAPSLVNHHGKVLSKNLDLALLWYGGVTPEQKNAILGFIDSLNFYAADNSQPQVSRWWQIVENYQLTNKAKGPPPRIVVRVVSNQADPSCSQGKVIIGDFLKNLIPKATQGKPNRLAVIVAAKDVTVEGVCEGKCSRHGIMDKQPYIAIGNPETMCPGECGWPFFKADQTPQGATLRPPSGNVGADTMIMSLAAGLAEAVSNPFNDGFFVPNKQDILEAASQCKGIFGSGAVPGAPGKVKLDPKSGASYNVVGKNQKKYLLPAVWNPLTESCWTPA